MAIPDVIFKHLYKLLPYLLYFHFCQFPGKTYAIRFLHTNLKSGLLQAKMFK